MELTDDQIWRVVEKMGKPAEGEDGKPEEYCDFYNQLKKMGACRQLLTGLNDLHMQATRKLV